MQLEVYRTENYTLTVGPAEWEHSTVPVGSLCYIVTNRHTGVREGEGSVLGRSIHYINVLEQELEQARDGIPTQIGPPSGTVH